MSSQFPILTMPEQVDTSSLFGTLEFAHVNNDASRSDPPPSHMSNGHRQPTPPPTKPNDDDDDDFVVVNRPNLPAPATLPPSVSNTEIQRKKLLWQIDYFSVPYYVRTCANLLFVCDKYGTTRHPGFRFPPHNNLVYLSLSLQARWPSTD